jgi:hypothetical protein
MHIELDHLFVCTAKGPSKVKNWFDSACVKDLQIGTQDKAQRIGVFLLPTLYVWIARPTDVQRAPETEFEN